MEPGLHKSPGNALNRATVAKCKTERKELPVRSAVKWFSAVGSGGGGRGLVQRGKSPHTERHSYEAVPSKRGGAVETKPWLRETWLKSFSTVLRRSRTDTTDSEDRFSHSNVFFLYSFCFATHLWKLPVRLSWNWFHSKNVLFFSWDLAVVMLAGLLLPMCHPPPPVLLYLNTMFMSSPLLLSQWWSFFTALDILHWKRMITGLP